MSISRNPAGLTLVEILVIILVVAILAALILPWFNQTKRNYIHVNFRTF
jgi:Tfp pilus assembly protein FimT